MERFDDDDESFVTANAKSLAQSDMRKSYQQLQMSLDHRERFIEVNVEVDDLDRGRPNSFVDYLAAQVPVVRPKPVILEKCKDNELFFSQGGSITSMMPP